MLCSVIICIFSNFHFRPAGAEYKRWLPQKPQVEMEGKQKRLKVKSLSKESTLKAWGFWQIKLQLRENWEILFSQEKIHFFKIIFSVCQTKISFQWQLTEHEWVVSCGYKYRNSETPKTAKMMLNVPQERFHDMVLFIYTVLDGPRRGSLKKKAQEMEKY